MRLVSGLTLARTKGARWGALISLAGVWCLTMGAGCALDRHERPAFSGVSGLYPSASPEIRRLPSVEEMQTGKGLNLSAEAAPLGELVRWLVNQSGLSVAYSPQVEGVPVTVEAREVPPEEILSVVARRAGVDLVKFGPKLYFLGPSRREDRVTLVTRCRRLRAEEIREALGGVGSVDQQITVTSDGLVIVGDRPNQLRAAADLVEQIEAAPAGCWVFQMLVVKTDDGLASTFGVAPSVDASAGVSVAKSLDVSSHWSGDVLAKLVAEAERRTGQVVSQPTLFVREGTEGRVSRTKGIPVPRKTVSDAGTVQTVGFDTIETGLTLAVTCTEIRAREAEVLLELELSEFDGTIEGFPSVSGERLSSRVLVAHGGVFLLGAVDEHRASRTESGILRALQGREDSSRRVEVWARVFKVG